MRSILFYLLLSSMVCVFADVLVLTNGTKITIPGSYMVKDNFVRYRDEDDQLLQIPLKLVNLEASEQATFLEKQLEQNPEVVKETPPPKKKSMAEIAGELDSQREEGYEAPKDVKLNSDSVKKYQREGPENSVHTGGLLAPGKSGSEILDTQARIGENYNKIADEIAELDKKIKQSEDNIVQLRNESSFGDDPTGAAYDSLKKFEEQHDKLLQERAEKMKGLEQVKKEAIQAGDKSIARERPVKKHTDQLNKEPDLKYRTKEDEFEYKEDPDKD